MRGAGQLQPASGDQADAVGFADHDRDAGAAGGVLDGGHHLVIVGRAHEDQPLGREAETAEARRIEVVAPQHPDRRAQGGQGPGQQGRERPGGRAGLHLQAVAGQGVPDAPRQTAARQMPVDPIVAERQHAMGRPVRAFQRGDLMAKALQA